MQSGYRTYSYSAFQPTRLGKGSCVFPWQKVSWTRRMRVSMTMDDMPETTRAVPNAIQSRHCSYASIIGSIEALEHLVEQHPRIGGLDIDAGGGAQPIDERKQFLANRMV